MINDQVREGRRLGDDEVIRLGLPGGAQRKIKVCVIRDSVVSLLDDDGRIEHHLIEASGLID